MEIEQIEEWAGQNVVDRDGEKIGKLEDVYFAEGSREVVFGTVKAGMLGRRHFLVPLADASVSRDHIRVPYSQEQIKGGPQTDPGATLESGMEQQLVQHYELDLSTLPPAAGGGYESATARAEREALAREATQRAEELEALADRKAAEAREAEQQADETQKQAQEAHDERDRAVREAADARAEARIQRPPTA